MAQQFFNNFDTTLTVELLTTALSMTVDDASGLPVTLGGGNSYLLTLSDGPVETIWEILLIDADRAGNVIAISARAQEGGADLTWPIGTFVSARVTAATMDFAHAHSGGGGGGGSTGIQYDRNMHQMGEIIGDNISELGFSRDGGVSWDGDRGDNHIGLAGGDTETARFVQGSGINATGICTSASSFG